MANAAAIGRELRADLSRTISGAMLRARVAITEANPVDTWHSANNWILSTGSPYGGIDGSRESPSDAAQQAGDQRMSSYDVGRDGKVFLRNNVEYVQFLDRGWSPQAEPGYVARAFNSAADTTPHGRRGAVRRMLRGMSRSAYLRGY